MRKRISLDSALVDEAKALSGEKSGSSAVTKALQEFIYSRRRKGYLKLAAVLEWDSDFNYKAERARS